MYSTGCGLVSGGVVHDMYLKHKLVIFVLILVHRQLGSLVVLHVGCQSRFGMMASVLSGINYLAYSVSLVLTINDFSYVPKKILKG